MAREPRHFGAKSEHRECLQLARRSASWGGWAGIVHSEPLFAVQPGGSLFGLLESNPVNLPAAYGGDPELYGQPNDPMVGRRIGGVKAFGGGLALYSADGKVVGGVGVSGDTSCTDHIVAWRTRDAMGLDHVPTGVSPTGDDNIIIDTAVAPDTGHTVSESGWGHPDCGSKGLSDSLPGRFRIGP